MTFIQTLRAAIAELRSAGNDDLADDLCRLTDYLSRPVIMTGDGVEVAGWPEDLHEEWASIVREVQHGGRSQTITKVSIDVVLSASGKPLMWWPSSMPARTIDGAFDDALDELP